MLKINVSTMTNINNVNDQLVLFSFANNAITSNAITPERGFFANQLSCQRQRVLLLQNSVFKVVKNTFGILFGKLLEFFDRNICQDDLPGISFHHRALKSFWLHQVCSVCRYLFQGLLRQEDNLLDHPKTVQGLFWRNSFWTDWWMRLIYSIYLLNREVSECLT